MSNPSTAVPTKIFPTGHMLVSRTLALSIGVFGAGFTLFPCVSGFSMSVV